jgi:hypothetical protein
MGQLLARRASYKCDTYGYFILKDLLGITSIYSPNYSVPDWFHADWTRWTRSEVSSYRLNFRRSYIRRLRDSELSRSTGEPADDDIHLNRYAEYVCKMSDGVSSYWVQFLYLIWLIAKFPRLDFHIESSWSLHDSVRGCVCNRLQFVDMKYYRGEIHLMILWQFFTDFLLFWLRCSMSLCIGFSQILRCASQRRWRIDCFSMGKTALKTIAMFEKKCGINYLV